MPLGHATQNLPGTLSACCSLSASAGCLWSWCHSPPLAPALPQLHPAVSRRPRGPGCLARRPASQAQGCESRGRAAEWVGVGKGAIAVPGCCCNKLSSTRCLRTHVFILLQVWRSKVQNESHWLKPRCYLGCVLFQRLSGRVPFPTSSGSQRPSTLLSSWSLPSPSQAAGVGPASVAISLVLTLLLLFPQFKDPVCLPVTIYPLLH